MAGNFLFAVYFILLFACALLYLPQVLSAYVLSEATFGPELSSKPPSPLSLKGRKHVENNGKCGGSRIHRIGLVGSLFPVQVRASSDILIRLPLLLIKAPKRKQNDCQGLLFAPSPTKDELLESCPSQLPSFSSHPGACFVSAYALATYYACSSCCHLCSNLYLCGIHWHWFSN